jgi:hypothetical protein
LPRRGLAVRPGKPDAGVLEQRYHRRCRWPGARPAHPGEDGHEIVPDLRRLEVDHGGDFFSVRKCRSKRPIIGWNGPASCSGWTKTFTDPRLCAAIVDRLTFGGNIIETGTDSYRLAHLGSAAVERDSR